VFLKLTSYIRDAILTIVSIYKGALGLQSECWGAKMLDRSGQQPLLIKSTIQLFRRGNVWDVQSSKERWPGG